MPTEAIIQSVPTPAPATPFIRKPIVGLTAAFVAGWLGALVVVQLKNGHFPADAAFADVKPAKPVAQASDTRAAQSEAPAVRTPVVAEAPPQPLAPALAKAPEISPGVPWKAPVEPAAAIAAIPVNDRQQEREQAQQLFQKNRDNLRILTSR